MKRLVDFAEAKDALNFKEYFRSLVSEKVNEALEVKKLEVADKLFNEGSRDPEEMARRMERKKKAAKKKGHEKEGQWNEEVAEEGIEIYAIDEEELDEAAGDKPYKHKVTVTAHWASDPEKEPHTVDLVVASRDANKQSAADAVRAHLAKPKMKHVIHSIKWHGTTNAGADTSNSIRDKLMAARSEKEKD